MTLAQYPAVLPGTGGNLATADPSQLTLTIDVANQTQTIKGFGASDCKSGCNSHLLFHEDKDDQRVLGIVKKAYEVITTEGMIQEIIVDEKL